MEGVCRRSLDWITLSILLLLFAFPSKSYSQTPVPNGNIFPDAWEPSTNSWVNGHADGLSEGQTAPMVVKITTQSTQSLRLDVCIETLSVTGGVSRYAFSKFSPWNTSFAPTQFPNGTAITISSTSGGFSAHNANITSITGPSLGEGDCPSNYLGARVVFSKIVAASPAFILYGGRLAKEGDPLPPSLPHSTVPNGRSASTINGTFQSRLDGSGAAKTINFSACSIAYTPGILLKKTVVSQSGNCVGNQQDNLTVTAGTQVKFCFEIVNTGSAPLINLTLFDTVFNVSLTSSLTGRSNQDNDGLADDLAVGASARAEYLYTVVGPIVNSAIATASSVTSTDTSSVAIYICGNGTVDPGEQCDDGNVVNGDGCNSNCSCGVCGCGVPEVDSDGDQTPNCIDLCPNDPNKIAPGVCGCGVSDTDSDGDGTANCNDACPIDPNKIDPGFCGCGVADTDSDGDQVPDCTDGCPNDPGKSSPGICGCGVNDVDSDGDGVPNCNDLCPADPNKFIPGVCGCGVSDADLDNDGTPDCNDLCPADPNKMSPGICGCGVSDVDSDGDQIPDCNDGCPADPNKSAAGICGCGVADADSDQDGTADCNDLCPTDPNKIAPGVCGCGTVDTDTDGDGVPNCNDNCPTDPAKINPGVCGCGVSDADTDGDGFADCQDGCPQDPNKMSPGICGCGISDVDSDQDGTVDCQDGCPADPNKVTAGVCGCGVLDLDRDGDGSPDCIDLCPQDQSKTAPGICGCGVSDVDTDGDGTADCNDACPTDSGKTVPGLCGCAVSDTDTDTDGTVDCLDGCPTDPNKIAPGACGCGVLEVDTDGDGTSDCLDLCPSDPSKMGPGICGCGVADTDSDSDGVSDCSDACPADPGKQQTAGICGCGVADADKDANGLTDCIDPQCTEVNISATQRELDGNSLAHRQLVERGLTMLGRQGRAKDKAFIEESQEEANKLYITGWTIIWTIPSLQASCLNTTICTTNDQTAVIAQYQSTSTDFNKLVKRVVKRLRQAKRDRKAGSKLLKQSSAIVAEDTKLLATIPSTTSTCVSP